MIETSVAHPAPTTIVEALEAEIARLKAARPHLVSRIARAESILVTQLSVSNGARPVKVRIASDGSRSYRVASGSKLGKVYTVEAGSFRCDCADSRRRHAGAKPAACKHGISCYILERALRCPSGTPKTGKCSGCGEGTPYPELAEVADYHESLQYFAGDFLCAECFAASDCF